MTARDPPPGTAREGDAAALEFFATAARGTAPLLADELRRLGAQAVREHPAGVAWRGTLATGYLACLWSRVAHRVLLVLDRAPAADAEAMYERALGIAWERHISADATIAVDFRVGPGVNVHPHFGAQRVKDAVADRFRSIDARRPSVDRDDPHLRISAHLAGGEGTLAIDLSGTSLHQRGYRLESGPAPLRETLAAAILLRSGWPRIAQAGGGFLDPMCGAGSLVIEAALIAADIAPGSLRARFGFERWHGHRPDLWAELLAEARARRATGMRDPVPIAGSDHDPALLDHARANAARAGVGALVRFEQRDVAHAAPPAGAAPGLVCVNPPYGARLAAGDDLDALYATLGRSLKERFPGWRVAVLAGDPARARAIGMRAVRRHTFWNGPIECRLLRFEPGAATPPARPAASPPSASARTDASGFANRLRKNHQRLARWAKRERVACYRVYDADLPEFALAVDLYHDTAGGLWVHAQEYAPPPTVTPARAAERLRAALAVIRETFGVGRERVFLKQRARQRGARQYARQADTGRFIEVREGPCLLLVNLADYLDTGLFLDQRPTRRLIGSLAPGRRFLNLFCYTASATVHAALGGAASTTSVDLSPNYLAWARRNLALNALSPTHHALVEADCRRWLAVAARRREPRYDLIYLEPPTFSNSKRMSGSFEVQRDHVALVRAATALLTPGGELIFSTNRRDFRLDTEGLAGLDVADISARTVPEDFRRNPRIHRCYRIRAANP